MISVFQIALNQELKMIYHSPRPYHIFSDTAVNLRCNKTFGNPSSHASHSSLVYLTLFLLVFHDKQKPQSRNYYNLNDLEAPGVQPKELKNCTSSFNYYLCLVLTYFVICSICFTRLLFAAHTLN
mmetsp:Transcript_38569/g.28443  ORF Transcript_38569/g.28443 Transcript_38569/m.28443 type:complete len:125 (+) Transcript_38569:278-652(+)